MTDAVSPSTLETRQLSYRETTCARRMVVQATATGDRVPKWVIAGVPRLFQLGHPVRIMIYKIAKGAFNRVVDRGELGEVREVYAIFCSAVCGVRKVWKRFARAENRSQSSESGTV